MLIPGLIAVWAIAIAWYALSGRQSESTSSFAVGSRFGSRPSEFGYLAVPAYGRSSVSLRTFRVAQRRRNVLVTLASATVVSLLLALVTAAALFWIVTVLAGALLAGYAYLLVQIRSAAAARRPLPQNVYQLDERRRESFVEDDRIAL